jgi:HSP90 family molecular chaperone
MTEIGYVSDTSELFHHLQRGFSDLVWVLFDQALLAEGGQPQDPAAFVKRLNAFMLRGIMT